MVEVYAGSHRGVNRRAGALDAVGIIGESRPVSGESSQAEEPLTLYLVKRLELVVRSLMDDALRPRGLTTLQFTALSVLARHDGLSSAALARRSFVTPQSMNEMVHWLEGRGLVDRERDPANRRVLRIRLAPAGRRLVDECTEVVRVVEDRLHAAMGADERADFRDGLRRGYEALLPWAEEARGGEPPPATGTAGGHRG